MRELWPSLQTIHARFRADVDTPTVQESLVSDAGLPDAARAVALPEPPAVLKHLFARRAAAANHLFEPSPNMGQVVLIEGHTSGVLPITLTVLLDEQLGSGNWAGWLVVPDTDYAAYWDVLLDHRDEPFDPDAGMIQVWNPVSVNLTVGVKVLAQLSPERLNAIRTVVSEHASPSIQIDETAKPGQIAPRSLADGAVVLTGTPLGDSSDPRRIYQSYYSEAASHLRAASGSSNVVAFPGNTRHQPEYSEEDMAVAALIPRGSRKGGAPLPTGSKFSPALWVSVIINITLLVSIVALLRTSPLIEEHEPPTTSVAVRLQVKFKASAQEQQIQSLLRDVQGKVVDGPSAGGQYVIEVSPATHEKVLADLQNSEVVESATR